MSVPAQTTFAQQPPKAEVVRGSYVSGLPARAAAQAFCERELKPRYAHYGPYGEKP